jgi:hypothetical protein
LALGPPHRERLQSACVLPQQRLSLYANVSNPGICEIGRPHLIVYTMSARVSFVSRRLEPMGISLSVLRIARPSVAGLAVLEGCQHALKDGTIRSDDERQPAVRKRE